MLARTDRYRTAGSPRTTSRASRKSGTRNKVEALENSTDRLNVSPLATKKAGMRKP
jgi:hypothetical protein